MTLRDVSQHEHDFGTPRYREIAMCSHSGCTEMRIGMYKGRCRELTGSEKLTVLAYMWEDLIYVDALTIFHGRDKAIERVNQMRGRAV